MKTNKGFTLIELLVVIAIIVILASIVLVGIQSATKKAKDARITANISQIRTQQEVYYSSANSYLDDEDTAYDGSAIEKLMEDIGEQQPSGATLVLHADSEDYCAYAQLTEVTTEYQCVDSAGNATRTTVITGCTGASAAHYTCIP